MKDKQITNEQQQPIAPRRVPARVYENLEAQLAQINSHVEQGDERAADRLLSSLLDELS